MKTTKLSEYSWQTKILWYAMLSVSIAALGLAFYELSSYSVFHLVVLAISIGAAALLNEHPIKITGRQSRISAGELLIFWGIIWFGLPGGVFIATASVIAKLMRKGKDLVGDLFNTFAVIVSALAAGSAFYVFLEHQAGFFGAFVGENPIGWTNLLFAAGVMAVVYFAVNSIFTAAYLKLSTDYSIEEIWQDYLAWQAVGQSASIVGAMLAHCTFLFFGIAFSLVIFPMIGIGHVAHLIHQRRLAQKTKEIFEASRVHLATVEALATAIDARDQVGAGHVQRTQIYATCIGENLGLSDLEIDALRTGALLHDIGKLAVPDNILNKPGRLSPAELEKIKIHSMVGASILEKVGFNSPVVPTVKYHHEKWDGSGYPEGLQGNEIPLTARILAIADTYDSLRSARPFRAAVARDEARRYLTVNAGTHFDPKIVDVFLRNLRRYEMLVEERGFSYKTDGQEEIENLHQTDSGDQDYVEQIKRANREVFTMYELARVFSSSLNLQETLALFARKIGDFVSFDTCAIYLLDESGKYAPIVYAEGKNHIALRGKRIKVGEGATGYVLEKRQSVQNINPALDFASSDDAFVQEYTAMTSLPLIAGEKIIGAVSIYSCELLGYQEEHLRLLETVSRIAADAIVKSIQHTETETRAMTDPMTGLPNARCLQMHFEKEVARSSRSGNTFQVLMLDLDGFKAVNDTFGHKVGDLLLKGVAKAMTAQLRDYDFLARYAGDEFVAIVPETEKNAVRELCERIEKAVIGFSLPVGDGRFARVGVSLGAASYPHSGATFDQVMIAADKAMYAVKAVRKQKEKAKVESRAAVNQLTAVAASSGQVISKPQPTVMQNMIQEIGHSNYPLNIAEDAFVVELDESHIVSSAVN